MKLREWVRTDERSQPEMAAFVGVTTSTFSRWVRERVVPAKRFFPKLRELTDNKVTLTDFRRARRRRSTTEKD